MVSITCFGGVAEIGGNKILIESTDGCVLLDFGRRMGYTGDFYSEFLQIRSKNALRDMCRLGILPEIDGIYAHYHIDTTILLEDPNDISKIPLDHAPDYWRLDGVTPYDPQGPKVDGVFLSHAHFDHIQDISFLDPDIPIYCTKKTEVLAKTISDVSSMHVDDQFYESKRKQVISRIWPDASSDYKTLFPGELNYSHVKEDPKPIRDKEADFDFTHEYTPQTREFINDYLEGTVKGINYKLIPVDHSVPGACSILLTLPDDKRILYTGDFRFHGSSGLTIDEYVAQVGTPVHAMITEGTRIESSEVLMETAIQENIRADIEQSRGLVLINFNWKDLSRFKLIYEVARSLNKTFVISSKLAYLLFEMSSNFHDTYDDPRTLHNLKVYLKREGNLLYSKRDYDKYRMGYIHFHGSNYRLGDRNIIRIAERLGLGGRTGNKKNPLPSTTPGTPYVHQSVYDLATYHLDNGIKAYEIRENPEQYIVMFSYWDANELFDLIPHNTDGGKTQYICATTEPFNDEMQIDETKFMNWLDTFRIDYESEEKDGIKVFLRRHVSGHASKVELKELIDKIDPDMIIPIHTEKSELFDELFPGKNIYHPKYGEPINI